jgi:hypothetical protein
MFDLAAKASRAACLSSVKHLRQPRKRHGVRAVAFKASLKLLN